MVCLLLKLLHYVGRDVSTVLLGRLRCGNVQLWCWSQGLWSWSCFHHWLFGHVIYCCSRCRLWLCHHPLHGVDSVHLEILLMGTCWQCGLWSVAFHNHKKVGETPFVQVSTTWALTCPETVHQRPFFTREIITWLSDNRVGKSSVVDHRSRRPVLSPLRNCVDRCHVWPYWASRCKPWRWMLKDINIHRPV